MFGAVDMETIFGLGKESWTGKDAKVKYIFEDEKKSYTLDELVNMKADYKGLEDRLQKQLDAVESGKVTSILYAEDYRKLLHILNNEIDAFEKLKWKSAE